MNQLYRIKQYALPLGILLVLYAGTAQGLTSDRNQPMQVEADEAELDDRTGVSIYQGSVKITQGSMALSANTMTVYNDGKQVTKILADGSPASYRQQVDKRPDPVKAQARTMTYLSTEQRIELRGNAKVWQGGSTFESEHISYDIANDVVNAKGSSNGERVRITIQPPSTGSGTPTP